MTSKRTLEAIEQLTAVDHPTATDWQARAERAEAECKELRERLAQNKTALLVARACLQIAKSRFDEPAAFNALNDAINLANTALKGS